MNKTTKVSHIKKARRLDDRTDATNPVEWQREFVNTTVATIHELLADQETIYGREFSDAARMNIIASLIASTVYQGLLGVPKGNAGSLHTATEKHHLAYRDLKEAVQNAVSSGFEGATRTWSGRPYEYVCTVQIVPEPISRQSN